ncbi:MAG: T9SS type A sorting domain-containing protein, partial [Candidatus Cloacimonadaceae bacterium]|nr:T9SS type A sorting domain-containing protein [Candidatus Cloacimonadaceae bacterium]
GMDADIFHRAISPTGTPSAEGNQIFTAGRLDQVDISLTGSGNTAFLSWLDKRSGYTNTNYAGNSIYGGVMQSGGSPVDDPIAPPADILSVLCYPNPFRDAASISFELREETGTYLAVYNLKGQKVRTLLNAPQVAGRYQLAFDGRDERGTPLGSGIYLLRLKAGNKVRTVKMVLLK